MDQLKEQNRTLNEKRRLEDKLAAAEEEMNRLNGLLHRKRDVEAALETLSAFENA